MADPKRPENLETAALLERLAAKGFRGDVVLHIADGIIGAVRVTEFFNRQDILIADREPGNGPKREVSGQGPGRDRGLATV
jgi:hypothetical protein